MKFFQKNWKEIVTTLLVFGALSLASISDFYETLTDKIAFTLFHWSEETPHDDIVIVAFDDATLNSSEFQRFQDFSRADYALLLENILAQNPKAIGMDIFFFNPSEDAAADERLANIIAEYPEIVVANEFDLDSQQFLYPTAALSIPPYQQGYVNLFTKTLDKNSVIAHAPLIIDKNNVRFAPFEPFVFRLWRKVHNGMQSAAYDSEKQTYVLQTGDEKRVVPVKNDLVNINFFGDPGAFSQLSLLDIWEGNMATDAFTDKIVFIGATAKDLHDEFPTPRSSTTLMSGVEIHANFLQTVLEERFISYQSTSEKILTLLGALAIAVTTIVWLSFWWATAIFIALGVAIYFGSVWLFLSQQFVVDFTTPLLALILSWGLIYAVRFFFEEQQKKYIRETFSKYVAKDIVDEMLRHPDNIHLGGEARAVTVFFSDLAGFTTLAEQLETTEVMHLLNEYLDTMSAQILAEKGTIDKYMGDAIMAFWGAPLSCADHAFRACNVALQQKAILPQINATLRKRNLPEISMRIGINSGMANVGNIGTKDRLEYTAIGDTVNLGARLESINKQYGTQIILSEFTYEEIKDHFFVRELDLIRVKGKSKPVRIFELLAKKGEQTTAQEALVEKYNQALKAYRSQEWKEAIAILQLLTDDPAAKTLLTRIHVLEKAEMPLDWDGVYSFDTK